MASTTGGFLVGVSLCIMLLCFGGIQVLDAYSEEIENARYYALQMYQTTHSSTYRGAMDALNTISPYASKIGDVLNNPLVSWTGLGWLGSSLKQIPRAASTMREIYDASEKVYTATQVIEVAPEYLNYGIFAGGALLLIGVALVLRARKRTPEMQT